MKEEFLFSNTLSATTTAADVNALVSLCLKPTSSAGRISSTSVLTVPSNYWHQIRACDTGEKRMASCDVLALFTAPIDTSIKDSSPTFDGSY